MIFDQTLRELFHHEDAKNTKDSDGSHEVAKNAQGARATGRSPLHPLSQSLRFMRPVADSDSSYFVNFVLLCLRVLAACANFLAVSIA